MPVRALLLFLLLFACQPAFAGFRPDSKSVIASLAPAAKPAPHYFNTWKRETTENRKKSRWSKLSLALVVASGFIIVMFFIYALAALAGSVAASLVLEKLAAGTSAAYIVAAGLNLAGFITGIVALCLGQRKKGFAIAAIIIGGLSLLAFIAALL